MSIQNPTLNRRVRPAVSIWAALVCMQAVALAESGIGGFLALPSTNRIDLIRFGPGAFLMGRPKSSKAPSDLASQKAAEPEHWVSLRCFWIAKYPVTVGQYCEFLNSGRFRPEYTDADVLADEVIESHSHVFRARASRQSFPMGGVTPAGAHAFCEWISTVSRRKCRLPTEAEWEFVAKGDKGRTYPWGEAVRARNPYGCPVGANPSLRTPEGVEDLNGPVYQYCLDLFDSSYYKQSPSQNPVCTNGNWPVMRGGPMFMFMGQLTMPATWKRFHAFGVDRLSGFRVVVEEQ